MLCRKVVEAARGGRVSVVHEDILWGNGTRGRSWLLWISDQPFGWNLPNWLLRREMVARLAELPNVDFRPGTGTVSLFTRTNVLAQKFRTLKQRSFADDVTKAA